MCRREVGAGSVIKWGLLKSQGRQSMRESWNLYGLSGDVISSPSKESGMKVFNDHGQQSFGRAEEDRSVQ